MPPEALCAHPLIFVTSMVVITYQTYPLIAYLACVLYMISTCHRVLGDYRIDATIYVTTKFHNVSRRGRLDYSRVAVLIAERKL